MKIIILTGSELRHDYFRMKVASDNKIEVLKSYCESKTGNLASLVEISNDNKFRLEHLNKRNLSEHKFFYEFCKNNIDESSPVFIEKGEINLESNTEEIIDLKPDLIISYGCSIIKSRLLEVFDNRFINVHLGLSPYYRGSGTNYWPLVNKEPEFVGTTFMYIDSGIDTGKIIHQIRADIEINDTVHSIGNRLIMKSADEMIKLINVFKNLEIKDPIPFNLKNEKYYRKKDFTEESLQKLKSNLDKGMINRFLLNKDFLYEQNPIISHNI